MRGQVTKKIRLNVESLVVETFSTADAVGPRGTVHGYGSEAPCDYIDTAQATCECQNPTAHTACGQSTCTCPANTYGQYTCAEPSCGLTYCQDTCDYCASFITDSPQRCPP